MVYYQPMLNRYEYHRMLLYLPGKMSARSWEHIVFADNNDVMTERDYAESLKE